MASCLTPAAWAGTAVINTVDGYAAAPPGTQIPTRDSGKYRWRRYPPPRADRLVRRAVKSRVGIGECFGEFAGSLVKNSLSAAAWAAASSAALTRMVSAVSSALSMRAE